MQVTVKKSILFNLLKNKLQKENRTYDNPSGNFISVIEKESGPFSLEDDDKPIQPSPHMAVQLSVEEPPVGDPDYIPASLSELSAAASAIVREVPVNQINSFYRKLHQILDMSLDEGDGQTNFLSEGINLIHESETMKDKLIQDAGRKVAEEFADASQLAVELIQNYSEFEDMDEFELSQQIDDASLSRQGVSMTPEAPPPPAASVTDTTFKKAGKTIMMRKKAKPEQPPLPSDTQEEEVEDNQRYQSAANKQEYLSGYDLALDVAAGLQVQMPPSPSDDFMAGYEDGTEADQRSLGAGDTSHSKDDVMQSSGDPVIDLVMMTHTLLFDISRQIEQEYFQANFTQRGKEQSAVGVDMSKTSKKYGITNNYSFTSLSLNKRSGGSFFFTAQKMQKEILNFMRKYAQLGEDSEFVGLLQSAASEIGNSEDAAMILISKILSQKYDEERQATVSAEQNLSGDELLDKEITKVFSKVTKKEPYKYTNVSRHFMNRATRDQEPMMIEDILTMFASKKKGNVYKIRKSSVPAEEFESYLRNYVAAMFDQAEVYQQSKQDSGIDDDVETTPVSDEEREAQRFANRIARLATTTNFDNLAPFFGFSSASGLRQWYLKHSLRKLKALSIGVDRGNKNDFAKLYEETFEAIAPMLVTAVNDKITKLENEIAGKQDDVLQQQLVILKHAAPQISRIVDLIDDETWSDKTNKEGNDMLYTVGGYILRTVNSQIYKPIMNLIDKNWTDFMAEIIESKSNANLKQAKSAAEYFTGKKEIPNYNEMTKAAKNLLKIGIDFEKFSELIEISNEWFEDTIETEFSNLQTADGTVRGEFLDAILTTISKISKEPKRIEKALNAALLDYLDDMAYQIAFKNLSQLETASGD